MGKGNAKVLVVVPEVRVEDVADFEDTYDLVEVVLDRNDQGVVDCILAFRVGQVAHDRVLHIPLYQVISTYKSYC